MRWRKKKRRGSNSSLMRRRNFRPPHSPNLSSSFGAPSPPTLLRKQMKADRSRLSMLKIGSDMPSALLKITHPSRKLNYAQFHCCRSKALFGIYAIAVKMAIPFRMHYDPCKLHFHGPPKEDFWIGPE